MTLTERPVGGVNTPTIILFAVVITLLGRTKEIEYSILRKLVIIMIWCRNGEPFEPTRIQQMIEKKICLPIKRLCTERLVSTVRGSR